jgi:hypothetical protein
MSYRLEVKYYNTFWLKQATTPLIEANSAGDGKIYARVFPGLPKLNYTNNKYPNFPQTIPSGGNVDAPKTNAYETPSNDFNQLNGSNWVIEESRIRGGFNNSQADLGVRAYLLEETNSIRYRKNSLIYSGIFNSRTNVNETNVFSIGEDITKSVDPHNGSIQLIYAMDNNLTIFQENKVSQALIDKDAVYTAEGTPIRSTSNVVIGQVTPYSGDYGISRNPESFASFGFRRYFTDKDRSAVMRLSRDGLTEISKYGMKDHFRDELAKLSDKIELTSQEYTLNYIYSGTNVGTIVQGPQDSRFQPNPPQPAIPAPLGPWFELADPGELDLSGIIVGSLVQLNLNTLAPGGGVWFDTNSYVLGVGTLNKNNVTIKCVYIDNGPLQVYQPSYPGALPKVRFVYFEKDKVLGGLDNYNDNYTLSIQRHSGSKTLDETSDYYSTVSFDERVSGWTTFYTYRPDLMVSLKNNFFTTKANSLYIHYSESSNANRFYSVDNESSVTLVFNASPSTSKNFKTINYEGSSGWQMDSMITDTQDTSPTTEISLDTAKSIKSYEEGYYVEKGIPYRVGFVEKENKYFANIVNDSLATPGEVNFGASMTGIKGHFATVKFSTDKTTNIGGTKQLFAISTEFVISSR